MDTTEYLNDPYHKNPHYLTAPIRHGQTNFEFVKEYEPEVKSWRQHS
jgi:hypothetical protein